MAILSSSTSTINQSTRPVASSTNPFFLSPVNETAASSSPRSGPHDMGLPYGSDVLCREHHQPRPSHDLWLLSRPTTWNGTNPLLIFRLSSWPRIKISRRAWVYCFTASAVLCCRANCEPHPWALRRMQQLREHVCDQRSHMVRWSRTSFVAALQPVHWIFSFQTFSDL